MKMKKLTTFALAAALAIGTFGFSVPAKATEPTTTTTDYVLTIPATLSVKNAGWNATDGIKADNSSNNFDTSKKLTVTAASTNTWALKSGANSVGYNLAASGDGNSVYNSDATAASWEFSAVDLNEESGKTLPMGIIVDDYSTAAAGTYQDTVTFTAKVEDATVLAPALENDATVVIAYRWNEWNTTTFTFTNNGGTYSCNVGGDQVSDFSGSLTLNGTTLALSITNSSVMSSMLNLAISFDTTNDTYSFVTKGSYYNSHTVSVNGTDITSKLTEAK